MQCKRNRTHCSYVILQASDYHAAHGLHSGNAIRSSAGLEFHFLPAIVQFQYATSDVYDAPFRHGFVAISCKPSARAK